jgi:hypothetical protein
MTRKLKGKLSISGEDNTAEKSARSEPKPKQTKKPKRKPLISNTDNAPEKTPSP